MRSTYRLRVRRRPRRPLGCLLLVGGAVLLLALIGSRTTRNWGVPSLGPRPTATGTRLPPEPLAALPPTAESQAAIPISKASPSPILDLYRQWISDARALYPYPDSADEMMAVMLCESGGDSAIVSADGVNHGLFQYSAATWAGDWNPYRAESLYDARAQIFATACAWSLGMQGQWGCYTSPR